MQKCIKAWAYGNVQGVGYRLFCRRKAREFGVSGYALNLSDGRVEVLMHGEEVGVANMIDALHQGPTFANVVGVDVEVSSEASVSGFMTG